MNVALCLSGQPRSVERAYPYILENIILPNDADVFVHAWADDRLRGGQPLAACGAIASDVIPENIEDVIINLYEPEDYIFEEQIEFDVKNYNERKAPMIKPQNSQSQWFSVRECFNLIDETKYDVIIRARFDWALKDKVYVSDYPLPTIKCPNDCPHPGGINDQFAFGHTEDMMIYGSLFDHMDYVYNVQGVRYCDEQLLFRHLQNHGIICSPQTFNYEIMRFAPDLHGRYEGDFYEES